MGPADGKEEIIWEDPLQRYGSGILYPSDASEYVDEFVEDDTEDDEAFHVSDGIAIADDVEVGASKNVTSTNMMRPSAFGLTFRTDSEELVVVVGGASYNSAAFDQGRRSWKRVPLREETVSITSGRPDLAVFDGRAKLVSRWRASENGVRTVTIAITGAANSATQDDRKVKAEDCLFQVSLRVQAPGGNFHETPPRPGVAGGLDERKFELQYRTRRTFARGHSCAAYWEVSEDESLATELSITHVPVREVFPTIPRSTDERACDLAFLAFSNDGILDALMDFVRGYSEWIKEAEESATHLDSRFEGAALSTLEDLRRASERMREGVQLLESRPDLLRLLQLANRVMLHQMVQASRPNSIENVAYTDETRLKQAGMKWRPFQLAYMLLILPSLVDSRHEDRDLVDLIWFQTGGGKTEAYLLVSAMEMMLRRVATGSEPMGTVVLMRYTLRLLTAQQFERVCRMVCALEIARPHNKGLFSGSERFTAGLWVGRENTPNTFNQVDQILETDSFDGAFGLRRCPWCSTIFAEHSFSHSNTSFRINCINEACEFHGGEGLPVDTVDESLYNNPPTLLLGTVDKFAQMAWEPRVSNFFGKIGHPPSLIVQDELHLLGGALGSVYGLYEAAIDALCHRDGALPKVVASTATIRDADKQIRALFGRSVGVFPPPGLSIDDSYFAQTTTEGSRLFVGILSSNKTATTSLIRTSAALAQAPMELEQDLTANEVDAYWTQVIYHSSLKEEGRTFSFLGDDIPIRIEEIASSADRTRHLDSEVIEELTSNVQSWRIPQILDRMSVEHGATHPEPLTAVTCTNMLSVGVDVPRLGLMIMHGQPKSTAEYIQATSRIGRQVTHPGLIVTHFRALGPRDMSHYEMFTSFHDAFYRFVEPASVTPMSLPCRQRALHASLVSVIRQWPGGKYSEDARIEFSDPAVMGAIEILKSRLRARCGSGEPDPETHIDQLVTDWKGKVADSQRLVYRRSTAGDDALLVGFTDAVHSGTIKPWRTLHSMRSVDADVKIKVEGRA